MRPYLIVVIFLILLGSLNSCHKRNDIHNDRLIGFNDKLVYTQDDIITMDSIRRDAIRSDDLNKKTDTVIYNQGLIYISCLRISDASSKMRGDIKIKSDTIKLLVDADLVATEENVFRLTYKIKNPLNKRYIIVKH